MKNKTNIIKKKTVYKPLPQFNIHQEVYNNQTHQSGVITGIAHINRKGEQCYCIRWYDDTTNFYPESIVETMLNAYEKHFAENHKILGFIRRKLGVKRYNSMVNDVFRGNKSSKELMEETKDALKALKTKRQELK